MARKRVDRERRVQIVEALHRCLLVKPYHQTTIKDIAAEAGVNHGVLHYYFSGKEEILLTYIDYIIDLYKKEYSDWLSERGDIPRDNKEFIREIFIFMAERITLNKNLSKVFIEIWEIASYNRKVRSKLQKAYQEWIRTVSGILERKTEDAEITALLSRGLVAYFEGMALFSVIMQPKDFKTSQILTWMEDRVMEMIG